LYIYPINDQWVKNHPHKLILIKQIVNHPVTYRIYIIFFINYNINKMSWTLAHYFDIIKVRQYTIEKYLELKKLFPIDHPN
jgi:hypothetical protein